MGTFWSRDENLGAAEAEENGVQWSSITEDSLLEDSIFIQHMLTSQHPLPAASSPAAFDEASDSVLDTHDHILDNESPFAIQGAAFPATVIPDSNSPLAPFAPNSFRSAEFAWPLIFERFGNVDDSQLGKLEAIWRQGLTSVVQNRAHMLFPAVSPLTKLVVFFLRKMDRVPEDTSVNPPPLPRPHPLGPFRYVPAESNTSVMLFFTTIKFVLAFISEREQRGVPLELSATASALNAVQEMATQLPIFFLSSIQNDGLQAMLDAFFVKTLSLAKEWSDLRTSATACSFSICLATGRLDYVAQLALAVGPLMARPISDICPQANDKLIELVLASPFPWLHPPNCLMSFRVPELHCPRGAFSIASSSEGKWIFVHGRTGLSKVGTGRDGTILGRVYARKVGWYPRDSSSLAFSGSRLFFRSASIYPAVFVVIDPETLEEVGRVCQDGSGSLPSPNQTHVALFVPEQETHALRTSQQSSADDAEFLSLKEATRRHTRKKTHTRSRSDESHRLSVVVAHDASSASIRNQYLGHDANSRWSARDRSFLRSHLVGDNSAVQPSHIYQVALHRSCVDVLRISTKDFSVVGCQTFSLENDASPLAVDIAKVVCDGDCIVVFWYIRSQEAGVFVRNVLKLPLICFDDAGAMSRFKPIVTVASYRPISHDIDLAAFCWDPVASGIWNFSPGAAQLSLVGIRVRPDIAWPEIRREKEFCGFYICSKLLQVVRCRSAQEHDKTFCESNHGLSSVLDAASLLCTLPVDEAGVSFSLHLLLLLADSSCGHNTELLSRFRLLLRSHLESSSLPVQISVIKLLCGFHATIWPGGGNNFLAFVASYLSDQLRKGNPESLVGIHQLLLCVQVLGVDQAFALSDLAESNLHQPLTSLISTLLSLISPTSGHVATAAINVLLLILRQALHNVTVESHLPYVLIRQILAFIGDDLGASNSISHHLQRLCSGVLGCLASIDDSSTAFWVGRHCVAPLLELHKSIRFRAHSTEIPVDSTCPPWCESPGGLLDCPYYENAICADEPIKTTQNSSDEDADRGIDDLDEEDSGAATATFTDDDANLSLDISDEISGESPSDNELTHFLMRSRGFAPTSRNQRITRRHVVESSHPLQQGPHSVFQVLFVKRSETALLEVDPNTSLPPDASLVMYTSYGGIVRCIPLVASGTVILSGEFPIPPGFVIFRCFVPSRVQPQLWGFRCTLRILDNCPSKGMTLLHAADRALAVVARAMLNSHIQVDPIEREDHPTGIFQLISSDLLQHAADTLRCEKSQRSEEKQFCAALVERFGLGAAFLAWRASVESDSLIGGDTIAAKAERSALAAVLYHCGLVQTAVSVAKQHVALSNIDVSSKGAPNTFVELVRACHAVKALREVSSAAFLCEVVRRCQFLMDLPLSEGPSRDKQTHAVSILQYLLRDTFSQEQVEYVLRLRQTRAGDILLGFICLQSIVASDYLKLKKAALDADKFALLFWSTADWHRSSWRFDIHSHISGCSESIIVQIQTIQHLLARASVQALRDAADPTDPLTVLHVMWALFGCASLLTSEKSMFRALLMRLSAVASSLISTSPPIPEEKIELLSSLLDVVAMGMRLLSASASNEITAVREPDAKQRNLDSTRCELWELSLDKFSELINRLVSNTPEYGMDEPTDVFRKAQERRARELSHLLRNTQRVREDIWDHVFITFLELRKDVSAEMLPYTSLLARSLTVVFPNLRPVAWSCFRRALTASLPQTAPPGELDHPGTCGDLDAHSVVRDLIHAIGTIHCWPLFCNQPSTASTSRMFDLGLLWRSQSLSRQLLHWLHSSTLEDHNAIDVQKEIFLLQSDPVLLSANGSHAAPAGWLLGSCRCTNAVIRPHRAPVFLRARVTCTDVSPSAASAFLFSNRHISEGTGIYYWEVKLRVPVRSECLWSVHVGLHDSVTNRSFDSEEAVPNAVSNEDTFGCGWLPREAIIFFTWNGRVSPIFHRNARGRFVPTLSMRSLSSPRRSAPVIDLITNFGDSKFIFDLGVFLTGDSVPSPLKEILQVAYPVIISQCSRNLLGVSDDIVDALRSGIRVSPVVREAFFKIVSTSLKSFATLHTRVDINNSTTHRLDSDNEPVSSIDGSTSFDEEDSILGLPLAIGSLAVLGAQSAHLHAGGFVSVGPSRLPAILMEVPLAPLRDAFVGVIFLGECQQRARFVPLADVRPLLQEPQCDSVAISTLPSDAIGSLFRCLSVVHSLCCSFEFSKHASVLDMALLSRIRSFLWRSLASLLEHDSALNWVKVVSSADITTIMSLAGDLSAPQLGQLLSGFAKTGPMPNFATIDTANLDDTSERLFLHLLDHVVPDVEIESSTDTDRPAGPAADAGPDFDEPARTSVSAIEEPLDDPAPTAADQPEAVAMPVPFGDEHKPLEIARQFSDSAPESELAQRPALSEVLTSEPHAELQTSPLQDIGIKDLQVGDYVSFLKAPLQANDSAMPTAMLAAVGEVGIILSVDVPTKQVLVCFSDSSGLWNAWWIPPAVLSPLQNPPFSIYAALTHSSIDFQSTAFSLKLAEACRSAAWAQRCLAHLISGLASATDSITRPQILSTQLNQSYNYSPPDRAHFWRLRRTSSIPHSPGVPPLAKSLSMLDEKQLRSLVSSIFHTASVDSFGSTALTALRDVTFELSFSYPHISSKQVSSTIPAQTADEDEALGHVYLRGFLTKQGKMFKQWKKYWCVLGDSDSPFLAYFKSPDALVPVGIIDLSRITSIDAGIVDKDKERDKDKKIRQDRLVFHLITDTRVITLQAPTQEDKDKWTSALQDQLRSRVTLQLESSSDGAPRRNPSVQQDPIVMAIVAECIKALSHGASEDFMVSTDEEKITHTEPLFSDKRSVNRSHAIAVEYLPTPPHAIVRIKPPFSRSVSTKSIHLPGSRHLVIEFDATCNLRFGRNILRIWRDATCRHLLGSFSGNSSFEYCPIYIEDTNKIFLSLTCDDDLAVGSSVGSDGSEEVGIRMIISGTTRLGLPGTASSCLSASYGLSMLDWIISAPYSVFSSCGLIPLTQSALWNPLLGITLASLSSSDPMLIERKLSVWAILSRLLLRWNELCAASPISALAPLYPLAQELFIRYEEENKKTFGGYSMVFRRLFETVVRLHLLRATLERLNQSDSGRGGLQKSLSDQSLPISTEIYEPPAAQNDVIDTGTLPSSETPSSHKDDPTTLDPPGLSTTSSGSHPWFYEQSAFVHALESLSHEQDIPLHVARQSFLEAEASEVAHRLSASRASERAFSWPVTQESPHPYPGGVRVTSRVHCARALYLIVSFDFRSKTNVGRDFLLFSRDRAGGDDLGAFSGCFPRDDLVIRGDSFVWSFVSEPSAVSLWWGFRFSVSPVFDEDVRLEIGSRAEQLLAAMPSDAKWPRALDLRLSNAIALYCERYRCNSRDLAFVNLLESTELNQVPELVAMGAEALYRRTCVLKYLNNRIGVLLPFVDMSMTSVPNSIAQSISQIRGLLFLDTKVDILYSTISCSLSSLHRPRVTVSRTKVASESFFLQCQRQLAQCDISACRQPDRCFELRLDGEGATDLGGPYRDILSQMAADVFAPSTRIFVPTPNKRNQVGFHQDQFIPAANSASDPILRSRLVFVGNIIGFAIRSHQALDLRFASLLWKQLVDVPADRRDLAAVDYHFVQQLELLESPGDFNIDQTNFAEALSLNFTVMDSCGHEVELLPNGKHLPVSWANRKEYVRLAESFKLSEFLEHVLLIRQGIKAIIPELSLFHLFRWQELELLVCGRAGFEVSVLRSHATYLDIESTLPCVQYFWDALDDMDSVQKASFLRFICGHSRLNFNYDLSVTFKIQLLQKAVNNPDAYLPEARTCFFTLALPPYTNSKITKEKLLQAITLCQEIDADFLPPPQHDDVETFVLSDDDTEFFE